MTHMNNNDILYYVVKYSGPFGFIKPWTAVRDGETYSQQFLTPSIIEGIEKKLFPEMLQYNGEIRKILRHRLSYMTIDMQQEQTQARGWEKKDKQRMMIRKMSVLTRGVLLNPVLHLAFKEETDAIKASKQHICLCRNEDVLIPAQDITVMNKSEFDMIDGFELHFGESDDSFMVGFNRFNSAKPMHGRLEISGKPVSGLK